VASCILKQSCILAIFTLLSNLKRLETPPQPENSVDEEEFKSFFIVDLLLQLLGNVQISYDGFLSNFKPPPPTYTVNRANGTELSFFSTIKVI